VVYDEDLAYRLRAQLASTKRVTEQEMFGGISFMVAGNMCCGVLGDDLVVRMDPTLQQDALTRPNVRELTFGNRTAKGMVRVSPAGVVDDEELALWVRLGLSHATSLPPKQARKAGQAKKAGRAKKAARAPVRKAPPVKRTQNKKQTTTAKKALVKKAKPASKAKKTRN
jgi:TfoX/Sxy family transcriptional regulator of competence genes